VPQVKVKSPQGEIYTVTAPDGATDEQIIAYARSQFEKPEAEEAPAPVVDPSQGRVSKSIERGWENLKSTGYGLAVLGADAVGADDLANSALEGYKRTSKKAESLASDVASYKDIKGFGDAGKYAVDAVFENLPMFLPSLVSGGIGATVARKSAEKLVEGMVAKKIGEGIAKEAAEREAAAFVAKRVAAGSAVGGYAPSAGMEAGSIYGDIIDQGGKRDASSVGAATAGGLVAGALDVVSAVPILGKIFGQAAGEVSTGLIRRLGTEGAKQFLLEGGTEGLQTIVEQLSANSVIPGKDISWDQVADAAIKGAIGGGVMGAGTEAIFGGNTKQQEEPEREVKPNELVANPEGAPAIGTVASIQSEDSEGKPGPIRNLTIQGYERTPEGEVLVKFIDNETKAQRNDLLLSDLNEFKVPTPAGVEPVTAAPVAPNVGDEGQSADTESVPAGGPPIPPPIEDVDAEQTLTAEEKAAGKSIETGGLYDAPTKPLKFNAVLSRLPTPELQLEYKTLNTQIKQLEALIPQVSDSPKLFAAKKAEYEQAANRFEELSKLASDPRQTGQPIVDPVTGVGGSLEGSVPFEKSAAVAPLDTGPTVVPPAPNALGGLGENAQRPGFVPATPDEYGDNPAMVNFNQGKKQREQEAEAARLQNIANISKDYTETDGRTPQSLFTYIRSKGGIDPRSDGASLIADAPKGLFSRKGGTGIKFNDLATEAKDYLIDVTDTDQLAEGEIGKGGTAQNTDALVKALSTNGGKDVYAYNARTSAESAKEKQRIKSQYGDGIRGVYRKVLQESYGINTEKNININEAKKLLLQELEKVDTAKETAARDALAAEIAASKAQQRPQTQEEIDAQIDAEEAAAARGEQADVAEQGEQTAQEEVDPFALNRVRNEGEVRGVGEPVGDELTGTDFNKMIESLKRIFPNGQIALRFEEKLKELIDGKIELVDGKYLKRVITIALDTKNKLGTLDHEVIHALRDLDVFTEAEWNALKKAALSNETLMEKVRKMYPKYTGEKLAEEAVAELHKGWKSGDISLRPIGTLKSGLQAIRDFFSKLAQWLGFNGFSSPEGLFEAVNAGRIGKRKIGQAGRRTAAFLANRPTTDKVTVYDEKDQPVLAEQYVVPGAEQAPDKAKSAANQKMLELARLKGQQSKMRSAKPQRGAGGMFGDEGADQGSLFQRRSEEVERDANGVPVKELEQTTERVQEINAGATKLTRQTTAPPNQDISYVGRYAAFASAVAAINRTFAKYHKIVRNKLAFEHAMVQDGNELLKKAIDLNKTNRRKLEAVLEHDRLEKINRDMNSKLRVVVTMPANYKGVNAKPGETIVLDAETKAALKDIRKLMADRWNSYGSAVAEQFGYTGTWDVEAIDKALNEAAVAGDRGAVNKLTNVKELFDQTKALAGYAPFMRYGDTGFTVKQKPNSDSPRDNLGGFGKTVHFEMIDTSNILSDFRGSQKHRDALIAKKKAELLKKFPEGEYEITAKRVEPEDIEQLDIPTIEKMFAALNLKQDAKRQEFLDSMIKQMREAQRIDFTRKSNNMPGYSPRILNSLIDYNTASAGAISGIKFNKAKEEAFEATQKRQKGSNVEVPQNIAKFAKKFNEYIDSSDAFAGRIKQYGFWTSLWASPASALVNMSQTPMITAAQIAGWANLGSYARTNMLALSLLRKMKVDKNGVRLNFDNINFASKAERSAFMQAVKDGTINPQTTQDLLGEDGRPNFGQSGGDDNFATFRKAFDIGSSMFTTAEQVNRAAAWLSAYREVQRPGALEKFKKMYAQDQRVQTMDLTKENIAKFITDETQFIGGKTDRPDVLRGLGGAVFQFKTYPMNYIRILHGNFTRQGAAGKMAGLMMMTALVAASGLLGLPFAEDALNITDAILTSATGIDPMIEAKVRNFVNQMSGSPEVAEMLTRGALRNTGVNFGSRLGQGEILPDANILSGIPVWGTTYGRFVEAKNRADSDQPGGAAVAALAPILGKGLSDIGRGIVLGSEGQRTQKRGDIKVPYSEVTGTEQFTKALGFQPAKYSRIQEEDRVNQRIKYKTRLAEQRLQSLLASHLANSLAARKAGDIEKADMYMKKLNDAYQSAARELSDPEVPLEDKVKIPSFETIKNRAISMINPEINLMKADRMKRKFMSETDETYMNE